MPNYVDNQRFYDLLVSYKNTGNRKDYNELGKIFISISEHMLQKLSFIKYTDDRKSEFVSLSCYYCVRYLKNYDVKYRNPFSYFSQIVWNSVLQCIISNKKRDTLFTSLDYLTSRDAIYASDTVDYCSEEE
jgi:hypothetical protein